METLEYSASFDNLTKGISAGVILLLGLIGYKSIRVLLDYKNLDSKSILIHSFILTLFLSLILISYLWSPKKYILSHNEFIVKKITNSIAIDYKNIKTVSLVNKEDMRGTIRTFGNGGLFGYYGKFHNSTFGNMNFQTTRSDHRVLIKTDNNKNIIVSPDDLSFVDELNKRIK